MNYNYHTHTFRCNHAINKEEEYVIRAIECGIKKLGFSDHIAFRFPDGFESNFRIKTEEVGLYFSELNRLREKYKDKIEIKIGFEMEYYPLYFEQMLENAISYGAEYLILGQHYLYNEHPNGRWSFNDVTDEDLRHYVDCIINGIKSGKFTYVAHPDLIKYDRDKEIYIKWMREVCVASREYNIPMELNHLGIRDKRNYPNYIFWQIAAEEQCPVTFGSDAHTAVDVYDADSIKKAKEIVEQLNLNYIGEPTLRALK